jgi:hypothetical protein
VNLTIQIGLVVLASTIFLVRLACALTQAAEDGQAIRERDQQAQP